MRFKKLTQAEKNKIRRKAIEAITDENYGDDGDNFHEHATAQAVISLIDELELKTAQRANWCAMAKKLGDDLDAAEKRIAELEAREVKPVAWRLINSPESSLPVTDNKHIADVWKRNGRDVQALFPVPSVDLVPVGTALSEGRQMSAHNKSMVVDVMVESGKLTPGDKLYIADAAGKGG
ncbi:hypothetical protein V6269_05650 [Enterobacter roggenkampii]|uniref:hypothetical protein n=1 Tax=Enterobacter roggenkampii TaxID=1812935 RepID=UPI003B83ED89